MTMRLLALDFDGVISDSAREAFVVALRTHVDLHAECRLAEDLERLDPERPEAAPLYPPFLEIMPLGNRAEDYETALTAIESGVELPDQDAYDAFRASLDPRALKLFHERFYRVRNAWSEGDPAGWRRALAAYPGVIDLLRRRGPEVDLAIASSKDRRSVRILLEAYGVAELFPEDRILDKETGVHKSAHLEHLREGLGMDYGAMTFVDDKVNHLDRVAPLGVRCLLAAWGYNGPREHALARDHGHTVVRLEDLEATLFGVR